MIKSFNTDSKELYMNRDDFIKAVEVMAGYEVRSIEWIYGLGDNCSEDPEEPLYYFDVTLQVRLENNQQGFISLSADSYCEDRGDCIGTLMGEFDECNSNLGDLPARVDIDVAVSLLREYLYEYAGSKEKPTQDLVYFESI